MTPILHFALVAIGSAIGGMARFGLGSLITHFTGTVFPWGTLVINLSGSLFLGWFTSMLIEENWTFAPDAWLHAEEWRLLVAVGVAGGYTTFSSFEAETYRLLREGMTWSAIFYVTGSVFFGLVAFRAGMILANGR